MKKTPYACIQQRNDVLQAAGGLILAGSLLSLFFALPDLAKAFWQETSLYPVNSLIISLTMAYAGAMFLFHRKHHFTFAAFLLLLSSAFLFGNVWLRFVIPLCLLLPSIGGRWNRPLFKKLPTPWLCLVGAALTVWQLVVMVLSIVRQVRKITLPALSWIVELFIVVGVFLLLFFTQAVPRKPLADFTVSRLARRPRDPLTLASVILLAAAFAFSAPQVLLSSPNYVRLVLVLLLPVAAFYLLCSRRPRNLLGLALGFLLLAFASTFFQVSIPLSLSVLILIAAAGFQGNDNLFRDGKHTLTVLDIIILLGLLLCLVNYLHAHVSGIISIIRLQPHKLTTAYRKNALLNIVSTFAPIFAVAGLMVLSAFSNLVQRETKIIAVCRRFCGKVKSFCLEFQKNSGKKLQKMAFVISCVFTVLCVLSAAVGVLAFAKDLVGYLVYAVPSRFAVKNYLTCFGAALGCLLCALPTWFVSSFGQINEDVHHVRNGAGPRAAYTKVDASETDHDLPDF